MVPVIAKTKAAPFGDRLHDALSKYQTPLCMGIDPHLPMLPPLFGTDAPQLAAPETLSAIRNFAFSAMDIASGKLPAIKPQVAFFEQHGPDGMALLADIASYAQTKDLLVIMDAKRGDIGSTSAAYAASFLGEDAKFPSDALTVNAYMGIDTLMPFIEAAERNGRGLFVLVRTSNPGSADLQEQLIGKTPLYHLLAQKLIPLADRMLGETGWSSLGIVAGATWPEEARQLRSILPTSPFLIPGYGAQGAPASDALVSLSRKNGNWQGGLVNASRGLTFPKTATSAPDISSWQAAILDQLDMMVAELNTA